MEDPRLMPLEVIKTDTRLSWIGVEYGGPAPKPRRYHSSVVAFGDFIIAGGQSGDSGDAQTTYFSDVHIYDTNSSKFVGSFNFDLPGRSQMSLAYFPGPNLIHFFGGRGSNKVFSDTFWLQSKDSEPMEWSHLNSTSTHPSARRGHSGVRLGGNSVIFGGFDNTRYLNDMWMFDVETARWLQHTRISGHVPHPRAFHGAVATDENSMYVFGGRYIDDFDVEYRELYKVHHFDIRSGQWSLVGGHPVVTGRYGMEVQYLEKEGKILIYGGQEAAPSATGELFYPEGIRDPTREVIMFDPRNPYQCTAIRTSERPAGRSFASSGLLDDGNLMVFGGHKLKDNVTTNSLWVLKPSDENEVASNATNIAKEWSSSNDDDFIATPSPTGRAQLHPREVSVVDSYRDSPKSMPVLFRRTNNLSRRLVTPPPTPHETSKQLLDRFLFTPWEPPMERDFFLPAGDVIALCMDVQKLLAEEPTILNIKPPVKIFGDTHGQMVDLLTIFKTYGAPQHRTGDIQIARYLFLGDFVDRGRHSLEIICLLFALKIIYPKKVFFVRGNHEVVDMNRDYGFREECLERFGSQDGQRVWISVNETFEYLSLGALVGKHVFCVHGGIGPNVMNTPIEEINHIEKPIRLDELAESNPRVYDIIHELLWSDPASDDETTGFTSNKRGSAVVTYGADIVRAYCQAQNLDIIVRAHECTEAGYDFFAGGRLITVFSATNYCGTMGNAAAFLLIDEDLTVFPKTIKPSNHPRAWPETQTRPPSPTRRRRSRSE